jgi:hypothetical protein
VGARRSLSLSHDLDFAAVLGARLFQRKFGEENAFAAHLFQRRNTKCSLLGARPPIGRVVTYRLKTATTKTAINTTIPAAMIESRTFGIFCISENS